MWEKIADGSNVNSWSVRGGEVKNIHHAISGKSESEMSAIKSPRAAEAAPARRRSKSPRRTLQQTAGEDTMEISDQKAKGTGERPGPREVEEA